MSDPKPRPRAFRLDDDKVVVTESAARDSQLADVSSSKPSPIIT